MKSISKALLLFLVIFLPLHAILVTFLKCKLGIDTDIIRFWKEIVILILLGIGLYKVGNQNHWKLSHIYKDNTLLGVSTAFIGLSLLYVYFPFFEWKLPAFLGFKYDVFFIFALIAGLYLNMSNKALSKILIASFVVTGVILIVFLPWYLSGNISSTTEIFGFSDKVSTYSANQCISFSQNVEGQHRFQGSFSGPIRWSVYLTVFYLLYLGFILKHGVDGIPKQWKKYSQNILKGAIILPSLFVVASIFFSYSKTSLLGILFGGGLFALLTFTKIYKKKISQKLIVMGSVIVGFLATLIITIKHDVFLHLGSVINRFDNLIQSIQMFIYNPIGYGLGIAGPASWTGRSIESAGSWEIAVATTSETHKFLPENWYVQILLEQGMMGLALFLSLLIIIGMILYKIFMKKKDFFSLGLFCAYMTLLFMANFTHAFEESATSYTLFLIIGIYISIYKKGELH